jgi:hypothetical protein
VLKLKFADLKQEWEMLEKKMLKVVKTAKVDFDQISPVARKLIQQ